MAQADFICDNATGAAFRSDLNNQLLALGTNSSGATSPSTTYAYQTWADTANNLLKIRNSSNTAWVTLGRIDVDSLGIAIPSGNRIINGAMEIDQRNNGAAHTITTASAYTIDRFAVVPNGASVTGQQIAGANAGLKRYRITGAAGVIGVSFLQRIESYNCADLAGGNATLSVDLANSLLTTVTWSAYYANTTDNWSAVTAIASGTFTVSSSISRKTATFAVPSAAVTGLQIYLSVGAQTSGTWIIGDMQLEAGSVATPFERRSVGQELALCQRYYAVIYANLRGTSPVGSIETMLKFPQTMRAIPTAGAFAHPSYAQGNAISETLRVWSSSEFGYLINGVPNADIFILGRGYTLSAEL